MLVLIILSVFANRAYSHTDDGEIKGKHKLYVRTHSEYDAGTDQFPLTISADLETNYNGFQVNLDDTQESKQNLKNFLGNVWKGKKLTRRKTKLIVLVPYIDIKNNDPEYLEYSLGVESFKNQVELRFREIYGDEIKIKYKEIGKPSFSGRVKGKFQKYKNGVLKRYYNIRDFYKRTPSKFQAHILALASAFRAGVYTTIVASAFTGDPFLIGAQAAVIVISDYLFNRYNEQIAYWKKNQKMAFTKLFDLNRSKIVRAFNLETNDADAGNSSHKTLMGLFEIMKPAFWNTFIWFSLTISTSFLDFAANVDGAMNLVSYFDVLKVDILPRLGLVVLADFLLSGLGTAGIVRLGEKKIYTSGNVKSVFFALDFLSKINMLLFNAKAYWLFYPLKFADYTFRIGAYVASTFSSFGRKIVVSHEDILEEITNDYLNVEAFPVVGRNMGAPVVNGNSKCSQFSLSVHNAIVP